MNKALHHLDTIKVRLRNQNKKKTTPNATQIPDRPQLGSTTDQLERNNTKDKISIELLLELGCVICTIQRRLQACFGSICESRGLSNLAPSRSRPFKLMGKVKGMGWSCSKRLAYMLLTYANKSEKRSKASSRQLVMINKWSWTPTYVKHNSNTMFTSRTSPERDHHGYTRGWCILIKVNFRFSTTGH